MTYRGWLLRVKVAQKLHPIARKRSWIMKSYLPQVMPFKLRNSITDSTMRKLCQPRSSSKISDLLRTLMHSIIIGLLTQGTPMRHPHRPSSMRESRSWGWRTPILVSTHSLSVEVVVVVWGTLENCPHLISHLTTTSQCSSHPRSPWGSGPPSTIMRRTSRKWARRCRSLSSMPRSGTCCSNPRAF